MQLCYSFNFKFNFTFLFKTSSQWNSALIQGFKRKSELKICCVLIRKCDTPIYHQLLQIAVTHVYWMTNRVIIIKMIIGNYIHNNIIIYKILDHHFILYNNILYLSILIDKEILLYLFLYMHYYYMSLYSVI